MVACLAAAAALIELAYVPNDYAWKEPAQDGDVEAGSTRYGGKFELKEDGATFEGSRYGGVYEAK